MDLKDDMTGEHWSVFYDTNFCGVTILSPATDSTQQTPA